MLFTVLSNNNYEKSEGFLLIHQEWNDWWEYESLYILKYIDSNKCSHEIGYIKIGQIDEIKKIPDLPDTFNELEASRFISLGTDTEYYENLKKLSYNLREKVLRSLNDIAFNTDLLDRYLAKRVVAVSLLRDIDKNTVRNQFHRMAHGGAKLTKYSFKYKYPNINEGDIPVELDFAVEPNSYPPTNIHVLIGRNAAGKTWLIKNIINSIYKKENSGEFSFIKGNKHFTNVVFLGFSAFDVFPIGIDNDELNYTYIGVRNGENEESELNSRFSTQFSDSLISFMKQPPKYSRWKEMIKLLCSDPIFRDNNWCELTDEIIDNQYSKDDAKKLISERFKHLSSGHKIVLLSLTKLVETVEEGTLVLLDEPELHLHPPLIASYVRALSYLMIDRNGVAIAATHSPVILQEVPRTCVWIIRRSGHDVAVNRPRIECFAENVGVLTSEVFGLEVTNSGYHLMLKKALKQTNNDYEQAKELFNGQIGMEGLSILEILSEGDEEID